MLAGLLSCGTLFCLKLHPQTPSSVQFEEGSQLILRAVLGVLSQ